MMDTWLGAFPVLLGWVLGIATAPIVEAIQRRRQAGQVRAAIAAELREIQFRLVLTVQHIATRYVGADRPLLQWVRDVLGKYDGPNADEDMVRAIDHILATSDGDLAAAASLMKAPPLVSPSLKKYDTPVLSTHLGSTALLGEDYRRRLIDIRARLGIFNDQVEDARFFFQKTFEPGLSSETFGIVQSNLRDTYMCAAQQARITADLIAKCL